MILITIKGDEYPKWTEEVKIVDGRCQFKVKTKSGKTVSHSVLMSEIIDIIDQDAVDADAEIGTLPDFTK